MEKKQKNKFFKNTLCSLYEVENFLCKYNKVTDIITLLKIAGRNNNKHKHRH